MVCEKCGGCVTWRGPLSCLTHTKCESCGGINCQIAEYDCPEEDYPEDGAYAGEGDEE